jgi:hypothetical protein
MSQELHYTSVPRGLKPGSRGFCTVGQTPHMSVALADRLEALSGYQPVFPPHDPAAPLNPIAFSHLRLTIAGKTMSVLSRIGPAGLDYTGRPNKYAHHLVLEGTERPEGGPAWLLSQPGFMQDAWDSEPREIPVGRAPFNGDRPPGMAHAWQALTGDGGWAGVLAESFLTDSRRTVFLVFRPGMDLLPLLVEALALLPASRRWDVDLSTYFSQLTQGVGCAWRGVLDGSADAKNARRLPNSLVLDLCQAIGQAPGGPLVHLARTGETVAEQSGGPITAFGAGRHIPRIPQRPAAPFDSPAGHAGSGQPRRASSGYDLIPELARLVPGARYHEGLPFEGDDAGAAIRRRRKRLPAVFVTLCAACMIVVLGVGLFLRPDVSKEISIERAKIAEARTRAEAETANENAVLRIEKPKPAENKHTMADPNNQQPVGKAQQVNWPEIDETLAGPLPGLGSPPNASPDTIIEPIFFPLEEPVSQTGTQKQKPLTFQDSGFRVAAMELLGNSVDLSAERSENDGIARLSVFAAPARGSELIDSTSRTELARFEARSTGEVRFRWNPDLKPVDKKEARSSLRDCVLKLTPKSPKSGEARYCILRSKPAGPGSGGHAPSRLRHEKRGTGTHSRYEWNKDNLFGETSRKPSIEQCKLLDLHGLEAVPLERAPDGSWIVLFEDETLFSASLDGTAVVIVLSDDDPGTLKARIESKNETKLRLKEAQSTRTGDTVRSEGLRKQIAQLNHERSRLQRLLIMYDSFLHVTITWEVAGTKLVIARVDFRTFAPSSAH